MNGNALTLAKYIVNKCIDDSHYITNLKLQQILYMIQLSMIKHTGTPAFDDELGAWQFGPIVFDVYFTFRSYGPLEIYNKMNVEEPTGKLKVITDFIVENNRDFHVTKLMEKTMVPGGPWDVVYNIRGGKEQDSSIIYIPKELLLNMSKLRVSKSKKQLKPKRGNGITSGNH